MELHCFQCGHELIIDDNWMGSDLDLVPKEHLSEETDFIVTLMHCPHCGMSYEVSECSQEEKGNYPYYKTEEEHAE